MLPELFAQHISCNHNRNEDKANDERSKNIPTKSARATNTEIVLCKIESTMNAINKIKSTIILCADLWKCNKNKCTITVTVKSLQRLHYNKS